MRGLLWVEQAEAIIDAIGDIPGVRMPIVREGCTHVYYTIPFLIELQDSVANGDVQIIAKARDNFCRSLESDGVRIVQGYVPLLYRPPAFTEFGRSCPTADRLHDGELFYIESCQWTFNKATIMKIGDAPDGREPHHPFNARICAAKPRCQQRTERPPMIRKVALADLTHPAFNAIGKDVRQIVRGGRE